MSIVRDILDLLGKVFGWWFYVMPWEQAVRVRAGKHMRLHEAGVYFKVPFLDTIWTQNVRRRASNIECQTLSTRDRKTVTISGSIAFRVRDVMRLQTSVHQAEFTIKQEVAGAAARYVISHELAECTPEMLLKAINDSARPALEEIGLADVEFMLIDYITTERTYRLVQAGIGWQHYDGGGISTRLVDMNAPGGWGR